MSDQIFDAEIKENLPQNPIEPDFSWKNFFRKKSVWISGVTGLVLIALISWYFFWGASKPQVPVSNNVILQIKGPESLSSGNEAEYRVIYRNGENAELVALYLEMLYPENFKYKSALPAPQSTTGNTFSLDMVPEGGDGEVLIRGKLSGSAGSDKPIKAVLHYKLSNFNSEFVVEQTFRTVMLPPNLTLDITGPIDIVGGQDSTFTVKYTNVASQEFDNLAISLTYPSGYSFTSATVPPSKNNNYWVLGKVPVAGNGSLEITGSFTGDLRMEKEVRADIGFIIKNSFVPQIAATATFKITSAPLLIKLIADKDSYLNLGDTIRYNLKYENTGTIGMSNLVITVNLDGLAINFENININDGIITGKTITWKSATLSQLGLVSPSEKGDINFNVPIKQSLLTNLKNQSISVGVSIYSDQMTKPVRTSDHQLKIISKLGLSVTGNFVSGALPMEVGKTTIYALTFILTNLSNDLSGVDLVAAIPLPASAWNNVVVPDSEKNLLTFDANAGKIYWKVGVLPAFTGKFSPARKVTFQLAVTPTETDRGKTMKLLSQATALGTDTFVNQVLKSDQIGELDTSRLEDDLVDLKGATVK